MRFVRAIAGTALLTIGLPVLLVAGPLGAVALRTEVRLGWLDPPGWLPLAAGAALVALGVAILAWPARQRPREVVFVVEPSQVPVLAARIGVTSLADLGRPDPANSAPAGMARPAGIVVPLPVRPATPVRAALPAAPTATQVGRGPAAG